MTGPGGSRFAAALLGLAALVLLPACAEDESVAQRDRRMLAADMAALAPQRPGTVDLYAIGFAGDSTEDVFRNEVDYLDTLRSEEHTSELQSLMRISYAVFCLKKKNNH